MSSDPWESLPDVAVAKSDWEDLPDLPAPVSTDQSNAGLIEPGNIDMSNRPHVLNTDGSISTVRSMSFGSDGREVLIPTVSDDGRIMSDEEAIATYQATGKHLGKFSSPEAATAFALSLHDSEASKIEKNPEQENGTLRWALDEAHRTNQSDELTALHLAEKLGVETTTVRAALPEFKRVAALADFDAERFKTEASPELLRLVKRNPALAPSAVVEEQPGLLSDLLRGMAKSAWDLIASPLDVARSALGLGISQDSEAGSYWQAMLVDVEQKTLEGAAAGEGIYAQLPDRQVQAKEKLASPEWTTKVLAARALLAAKTKPKTTQQVDDEVAAKAREAGFAGLLAQRYQESTAGLEASRLRTAALLAETRLEALGPDVSESVFADSQAAIVDMRSRIHDLELQAQSRALGEGEYGQLAGSAVQGVASTIGGMPKALEALGMLGVAGGFVGAAGGAASGVGAAKGAQAGAYTAIRAKGGTAALMGFGYDAFLVETGATSRDLEAVTTDAGKRLTRAEVLGGSLAAGALKAGVEVLEVQAVAKTFGPLKAMLEAQGARGYVRELLATDPRFRAVAARAAGQWLRSGAVEGIEEGVQSAIDGVVQYLVKSIEDRAPQVGPVLDREAGAEAMVAGTVGGLAMGAAGAGTQLVAAGASVAQGAHAPHQVTQVLELAQHPAAQAAPREFAQAATEATATTGQPVTALHVDGAAAARYFQEQAGGDPQTAARLMTEALGKEAPARVAEALWTGGKVEVPLKDVLGRYGSTEAAKALEQDTTTHPDLPTPREATRANAAVEEQAAAIARQAIKDSALETQTEAFRDQLIAAGRTRQEASVGAALVRSFMATQAKDFDQAVGELFPELPITAGKGDEAVSMPAIGARTEQSDPSSPPEETQPVDQMDSLLTTARDLDPQLQETVIERTLPTGEVVQVHPDFRPETGAHDTANRDIGEHEPSETTPREDDVQSVHRSSAEEAGSGEWRQLAGAGEGSPGVSETASTEALLPEDGGGVEGAGDEGLQSGGVADSLVELQAIGFNSPDVIAEARARVGKFRVALTKVERAESSRSTDSAARIEKIAKARLDERKRATLAYLDFCEGKGPGLKDVGTVGGRTGAMAVPPKLRREVELWAREIGILDPVNGLDEIMASAVEPIDPEMRRSGTSHAPRTSYDRAIKRDRRDAMNANVHGRKYQDTSGSVPKGYTELDSTRRAVKAFFNQTADLSTVIHELGHGFLDLLRELAERPDAPQRTRETWAAAQAFLGHEKGAINREQHEKWARSFEAYLMEGKAPSGVLAKTFARAKLWMMDIYRAIRGIPGAALNDDARRVFDALLATEDEIKAARKRQGPVLYADAKAAGMTDEAWMEQLEAQREAYDEGNQRVQLQAIKDALRVHESWWKAGIDQLEARFTTEYEMLPARVAQRIIDGTDWGEPIVMDRDAVRAVIGNVRVPGLKTAVDGVRPGAVAEIAGFPSGDAMLAALAGLRPRERWVREQADAEMRRLNPGILEDLVRMRREVADGLHAVTEKRLLDEWAALRREDPTIGATPIVALKRAAKMIADQRQAGKLRPAQALQLERRAAEAKAKAAAKGDWTAAAKAAREQLLNAFVHAELTRAESEVEKLETLAKRMSRAASRERLGKASPVYRDAVDFLLGATGLGSPIKGLDTSALRQAIDQMNGDAMVIGDPDWLDPVVKRIASGEPWHQWTMADVRQLRDALKTLSAAATQRSTVLLDDKRASKEEVKAAVVREVGEHLRVRKPIVEEHARTATEKLAMGLNQLDGWLLSPVDVVRDLVGDDQASTTWKAVVLPLRRAEVQEADMLRTVLSPVLDSFEKMPPTLRQAWADPIDGRKLFPNHIESFLPRRRAEIIMMALNSGSETSLKALTEGRGITLDQLHKALGALTSEEIGWINGVFKQLESLREEAFALEERETGLRPQAVQAVPIQLPNGRLNGGYFPLKAIKEGSVTGEHQAADQVASLFDPSYTRPVTSHGHLKSRTGAAYPVMLDPEVIRRHLVQVVHDITFREAVKSVAGLVMDPEVKASLIRWAGPAKADQFVTWLKDIAGANGVNSSPIMRWTQWLKGNMATALLSGPSTAIGNLANLPTAVASTKLKTKHLAAALAELGRAPTATRATALERSGILRQMSDNLAQDFERSLGSLRKGVAGKALDLSKDVGLWLMRSIDTGVSTAVWSGAYRQALAEGMEPKPAARWADDLLLQVQPSSSAVEKAGILRDRTWGAFVMFYGYLSVAYRAQHRMGAQLITREFQEAGLSGKGAVALKTAGALFGFWAAYQVVGELLMGRGPEDGDRDDEDPENEALKWRNWFLRKVLVAPLAVLPLVPVASSVEGMLLAKPVSPRQDPLSNLTSQIFRLLGATQKYVHDEGEFSKMAIEALRTAGLLTGFPARLVETTGKATFDIATGAGEPVNSPGEAVSRIVYGDKRRPPDNLITSMAAALGL